MNLEAVLNNKDSENAIYGLYISKGNVHTKQGRLIGMTVGDKARLKGLWDWARRQYPDYNLKYYFENFVNYGVGADGKEYNFI